MRLTLGEAMSDSRGYWQYRLASLRTLTPRLVHVPLILLGGVIVGGVVLLVRRGELFIPLYIVTSVTLLCATPWPEQFRRYLVPVAPFLLAALFSCVIGVANWLWVSRRTLVRTCAPIALLTVLALIFDAELNALRTMHRHHLDRVTSETYEGKPVHYRLFYYGRASKALDDGLDWLKQRARPDDVVATSMPHWAYLRKGLKAVRPPLEPSRERTQALLDSVPVTYIVLSPQSDGKAINNHIFPFVESNPRDWKPVYVDAEAMVRIYERVRSDETDNADRRTPRPRK
jgi:hypothetical protein